jgi:hypothetical protein
MFRYLVPVFAVVSVLALSACNNGQNGGRRQIPPDKPHWVTVIEDGRTRLVFGLPDSDIVALSLECEPHSGRVTVTGPVQPGEAALVLVSGSARAKITGATRDDPEADVAMLSGFAGARDAALRAFARTGQLMRVDPAGTTALPAHGAQRARVRAFLRGCSG